MAGSLTTWPASWNAAETGLTQKIFANLKDRAKKGEKVGLLYSANDVQAQSLHTQNNSGRSPPYKADTIDGDGQAILFRKLIQSINEDTELSAEQKKNIRILPIATSLKGSSDQNADGTPDETNTVSRTELDRDIKNIQQHIDAGWNVVAPPRVDSKRQRPATPNPNDQFGIGGGYSQAFMSSTKDKKWQENGKSRNQFVQQELNAIQNRLSLGQPAEPSPTTSTQPSAAPSASQSPVKVQIAPSIAGTQQALNVIDAIISDYNKHYAQPNNLPSAQRQANGLVQLEFKSHDDALKFVRDQAAKPGRSFIVKNDQGDVLGFAKNGQFFNADNTPCTGNTFGKPMKLDEFQKQQQAAIAATPAAANPPLAAAANSAGATPPLTTAGTDVKREPSTEAAARAEEQKPRL